MGKKGTTEDGQEPSDTKGEYWVNLPGSEMSYKQNQIVYFSPEILWEQIEVSAPCRIYFFHSAVLKTCISQAAKMKIGKVLKQKEIAKS